MAPRVGFEPTTNRLTAGCSTTELPRNSSTPESEEAGLYQVRRQGESPVRASLCQGQHKTRAPCGALEGVGYGGVSPREDRVKIALTGKQPVNDKHFVNQAFESVEMVGKLEASPGIEPGCKDLQSSA